MNIDLVNSDFTDAIAHKELKIFLISHERLQATARFDLNESLNLPMDRKVHFPNFKWMFLPFLSLIRILRRLSFAPNCSND